MQIDEEPRNADWLRVLGRGRELGEWPTERIEAACAPAHAAYGAQLRARHRHSPNGPHIERREAFPAHLEWIASLLPPDVWHDAWWAAKSSQTLALTLLAAAQRADPTLSWLPFANELGRSRLGLFEIELAEDVLNERPHQTQLDFVALGDRAVISVEAKFTESGLGHCRCAHRQDGICGDHIHERPYWRVAERELGLRQRPGQCSLSVAYQAVRNIAAAAAVAGPSRSAAFVLLYDDRNPFFTGAGDWPGWVAVLEGLTAHATIRFAALSWQALVASAPLDAATQTWAREKHGIEPAQQVPPPPPRPAQ